MENLISNIYEFIESLKDSMILIDENFIEFLSKNIFLDSSLIGLNLTYYELLMYVGTIFISGLFIVLFIKIVGKFLYLFK